MDICALTDTLIVDQDGVYDPNAFNDRVLLGFKIPSLYNTSFTYGLWVAPSAVPASRGSG